MQEKGHQGHVGLLLTEVQPGRWTAVYTGAIQEGPRHEGVHRAHPRSPRSGCSGSVSYFNQFLLCPFYPGTPPFYPQPYRAPITCSHPQHCCSYPQNTAWPPLWPPETCASQDQPSAPSVTPGLPTTPTHLISNQTWTPHPGMHLLPPLMRHQSPPCHTVILQVPVLLVPTPQPRRPWK